MNSAPLTSGSLWRHLLPRAAVVLGLPLLAPLTAGEYKLKYPEYPVRRIEEYSLRQSNAGLTVAIEPMDDVQKQKEYFKFETRSKGFVPVFIILQYDRGDNSVILKKENVGFTIADSGTVQTVAKVGVQPGEKQLVATDLIISPMLAGAQMAWASERQQNIITKELRSQSVSPGGSVSGFVYVPVPKSPTVRKKILLHLRVVFSGGGDPASFDLIF